MVNVGNAEGMGIQDGSVQIWLAVAPTFWQRLNVRAKEKEQELMEKQLINGYGKTRAKYNGYRPLGKAIGKGYINYYEPGSAYWNIWGSESDCWG